MGILRDPLDWIKELSLPAQFSVCELGDQYITCVAPHRLAKDWYLERGCGRYVSIDGNGRGTVTKDLNHPLNPIFGVAGMGFDLVTDFGTGEHIFDQAQVWRTLHDLTKPGGYLIVDRPCLGYPGHGFYLIDPGLLTDIAEANAYTVLKMVETKTARGRLVRALFQRTTGGVFRVPQQRRYRQDLVRI